MNDTQTAPTTGSLQVAIRTDALTGARFGCDVGIVDGSHWEFIVENIWDASTITVDAAGIVAELGAEEWRLAGSEDDGWLTAGLIWTDDGGAQHVLETAALVYADPS